MYDKSILNEIRDRISMSTLIGERIPLKRAGRGFKGRCPFHNEKTPSFNVNDEKGIYHCFGCGEGGDAFQFLMKFDGLSFAEAVEALAAKAGVTLPRDQGPAERAAMDAQALHRKQLLRVNQVAMEYFRATLEDGRRGAAARDYLASRGIKDEISKQHFLGYAEDSWESLVRHLESKGVPQKLAAEAGLIKVRQGGGHYDFFRHRLIFPILSSRGEVLGFGGRQLAGGAEKERGAKYLNSPDSPIYHKSNCVYGLDRSAQAIRSSDFVVLVEGYMDFIALHQAGIENVAAPLGTALTEGHIEALRRLTHNMVLVFDGDEAGQRASMRALPLYIDVGLAPRVVVLPVGDDPDTFVRREGALEFRRRLDRAKPLFEHFVEQTIVTTGLDSAGKVSAISRIAPFLRRISDPVELSVLMQYVSRRIDVDEASLSQMLGRERNAPAQISAVRREKPEQADAHADRTAERLLVAAMFADPGIVPEVFAEIGPASLSDEWCRTAATLVWEAWQAAGTGGRVNLGALIDSIEDEELATQLRALAVKGAAQDEEEMRHLVKDCTARISSRPDVARLDAINHDIKLAEGEGDDERIFALLAEKRALVEKVRTQ
ncbi:MAG: DNA primase [bacterium]